MGKNKRGALRGLSSYVFESFKSEPPTLPTTNLDSESNLLQAVNGTNVQAPGNPDQEAVVEVESRPTKKRKANDGSEIVVQEQPIISIQDGKWIKAYDATGLVPHYSNAADVPEHLQKYFSQRTRYFSLYSQLPGCLLDEEGWYSVTPERVADQIAERCRCDTILDAFCGVGGNTIAFAKTCQRVIALDTSPIRLALARHNAQIYGVADRIEFILSDYISFANAFLRVSATSHPGSAPSSTQPEAGAEAHPTRQNYSQNTRKIDVVFLSPPWGGPTYLSGSSSIDPNGAIPLPVLEKNNDDEPPTPTPKHPTYSLSSIQPIHGEELFKLTRRITKNVAYYLPRNTKLEEISKLLDVEKEAAVGQGLVNGDAASIDGLQKGSTEPKEVVEVEEEWMGNKLKALTCYFGGLADGQGQLF